MSTQASRFFRALYRVVLDPDGSLDAEYELELRSFKVISRPDRPKDQLVGATGYLAFENVDHAATAVERQDRQGWECYFGVHPRRRGVGAGGDSSVPIYIAIMADVDLEKRGLTEERVLALVESFPWGGPSISVRSGGGLHLYWLYREPVDAQEKASVELHQAAAHLIRWSINTALDIGVADNMSSRDRILRVPGSHNYKRIRRRADGSSPGVELLAVHDDRFVTPEAVLEFAPQDVAWRAADWDHEGKIKTGNAARKSTARLVPDDLPTSIPERVKRVLAAADIGIQNVKRAPNGGVVAILISRCPACGDDRGKCYITVNGRLKSHRQVDCPAGESGTGGAGLAMAKWVPLHAPHAMGALKGPDPDEHKRPDSDEHKRPDQDKLAVVLTQNAEDLSRDGNAIEGGNEAAIDAYEGPDRHPVVGEDVSNDGTAPDDADAEPVAAQAAEPPITVENMGTHLEAVCAEAEAWTSQEPSDERYLARIAILVSTVGSQKTSRTLRKLLDRMLKRNKGALLAPSHLQLDEREEEADKIGLIKRRRHFGVLTHRQPDGTKTCLYVEQLRDWARRGYPLRKTACIHCPHLTDYKGTGLECPAFAGPTTRGPVLAVQAHGQDLIRKGALHGMVYIDELLPLIKMTRLSIDEIALVTAAQLTTLLAKWCTPRATLARIVVRASRALATWWKGLTAKERRYPKYINGAWLGQWLEDAALEESLEGQRVLLGPPQGGRELLRAAVSQIRFARLDNPLPPTPPGPGMRTGNTSPESWPHAELDNVLLALAGEAERDSERGPTACLVVDGRGVHAEWRRPAMDEWIRPDRPHPPLMMMDASAGDQRATIAAGLAKYEVKFFCLKVQEIQGAVRRVQIATSSINRKGLFDDQAAVPDTVLRERAALHLVRLLREVGRRLAGVGPTPKVGLIAMKPLARILRDCRAVLDCKGEPDALVEAAAERVIAARAQPVLEALRKMGENGALGAIAIGWQGNVRGSNEFNGCRVLVTLGDPWPNIGAAYQDARTLGIDGNAHAAGALRAEQRQDFGRGREIWRTPDDPLLMINLGREVPAPWAGHVVEIIEMPAGGRLPSEIAEDAEALLADALGVLGAISPRLVPLFAADAALLAAAGKTATTAIRESINSSCGSFTEHAAWRDAAVIAERTLHRIVAAVAADLPHVTTFDPTREKGGYWKWAEKREGAALSVAEWIRAELAARPQAPKAPNAAVDDPTWTADFPSRWHDPDAEDKPAQSAGTEQQHPVTREDGTADNDGAPAKPHAPQAGTPSEEGLAFDAWLSGAEEAVPDGHAAPGAPAQGQVSEMQPVGQARKDKGGSDRVDGVVGRDQDDRRDPGERDLELSRAVELLWGIAADEALALGDRAANDDALDCAATFEDDERSGWGTDCESDEIFDGELGEFFGHVAASMLTPPVLLSRFAFPEVRRVAEVLRAVFGPVALDVDWSDPARRESDLRAQAPAQLEPATFGPMKKTTETFDPGEWPVIETT